MRTVPIALAAAALVFAGCGASSTTTGNGATLDVPAFKKAMAEPGTTILDVRTPNEFASGHLANAKNLDVEDANFATAIKELRTDGAYAVYCRTGRRSQTALDIMQRAGFTRVYHLGGGITAWVEAGEPVGK